jgi:hypothetical protein
MDVPTINANREANVGKTVTVSGFYMGTTKQGNPVTQLNVAVHESEEMDSASILWVATPDHAERFDPITMKSPITVTGKVAEKAFFDKAMLEECVLGGGSGGGEAAPKEDKAGKAKGGKAKGGKAKH